MISRNVERVEIVVFRFDFRSVEHREAQRYEQLFDFALHLRHGMQTAGAHAGGGRCKVQPLGFKARVQRRRLQRRFTSLDLRF